MTARLEFGEVRMSYAGGGRTDAARAEAISRLTFEHVERLLAPALGRLRADRHVRHLSVGPVHVSLETMDDEAIARASALEIYRALLGEF
jgi:hypothetical protein